LHIFIARTSVSALKGSENDPFLIMKKTLDELAESKILFVFRDKVPIASPEGNVYVFSIRDLTTNWPLKQENLIRTFVDENKLSELVQPGDILLPGRGQTYLARVYDGDLGPIAPAGQIYLIRPRSEIAISSEYIAWYINRPNTQHAIRNALTGTTVPTLNKSALQRLEIDVPPQALQNKIIRLSNLYQKRFSIRERLTSLETHELELICQELLANENDSKD
jgi:restriction endonuclease S subunit